MKERKGREGRKRSGEGRREGIEEVDGLRAGG